MVDVHVAGGELGQEEINTYIQRAKDKYPGRELQGLDIVVDGEYVDLQYHFKPVSFSRIRRITGYLVGDMGRWNNAKAAEERNRVKHGVS
nr:anaerobic ribonucleoside-triphosphate reductase [bacterium]